MMPAATATASVNATTKIERDLIEARHRDAIPDEGEQTAMAQCASADPGDAGSREHDAFGEHLPHEAITSRSKRRPHADLAFARGASSEQQIRNIHARDEQDHGSGEREDGESPAPGQLLVQPEQHDGPAGIALHGSSLSRSARCAHVAIRLLERNAAAQTGDGV